MKIRHFRNLHFCYKLHDVVPHNLGGYTIAFDREPDSGDVKIGIAACSSKENFNKRVGRTIAAQRLNSEPVIVNSEQFEQFMACEDLYEFHFEAFDILKEKRLLSAMV